MTERPTIDDVRAAQDRLHGVARVTPVYSSETLSRLAGRNVLLKAENLQRTGAFKIRGAYNTIAQLSEDERAAGSRHRERREPRPGSRVGGARGRHRRDDRRPRGRADGEGRGGARLRRDGRARRRGVRRDGRRRAGA